MFKINIIFFILYFFIFIKSDIFVNTKEIIITTDKYKTNESFYPRELEFETYVYFNDLEAGYTLGYLENYYPFENLSVIESNIVTVIDWENSIEYWWESQFLDRNFSGNCSKFDFSNDINSNNHVFHPSIFQIPNGEMEYKGDYFIKELNQSAVAYSIWNSMNSFVCKVNIHSMKIQQTIIDGQCLQGVNISQVSIIQFEYGRYITCSRDQNGLVTCPVHLYDNTTVQCQIPKNSGIKMVDLVLCPKPNPLNYYIYTGLLPIRLEINGTDPETNQTISKRIDWMDIEFGEFSAKYWEESPICKSVVSRNLEIPHSNYRKNISSTTNNTNFPYYTQNSNRFSIVYSLYYNYYYTKPTQWIYESKQRQFYKYQEGEFLQYIRRVENSNVFEYEKDFLFCRNNMDNQIQPVVNVILEGILSKEMILNWTFSNRTIYNDINCDQWDSIGPQNETISFLFAVPEWKFPDRDLRGNRVPLALIINGTEYRIHLYLPIFEEIPDFVYSFDEESCFPVIPTYSALVEISIPTSGIQYTFNEYNIYGQDHYLEDKDRGYIINNGVLYDKNNESIHFFKEDPSITFDPLYLMMKDSIPTLQLHDGMWAILKGENQYMGVYKIDGYNARHWRYTSKFNLNNHTLYFSKYPMENITINYYFISEIIETFRDVELSGIPLRIDYHIVTYPSELSGNISKTIEMSFKYYNFQTDDIIYPPIPDYYTSGTPIWALDYSDYKASEMWNKDKLSANKKLYQQYKLNIPQQFTTMLSLTTMKDSAKDNFLYKWTYNKKELYEQLIQYQDDVTLTYTLCYHDSFGGPAHVFIDNIGVGNIEKSEYSMGSGASPIFNNMKDSNEIFGVFYHDSIKKYQGIENLILSYNSQPARGYQFTKSKIEYHLMFYPDNWNFTFPNINNETSTFPVPMVFKRNVSSENYEIFRFVQFKNSIDEKSKQDILQMCKKYQVEPEPSNYADTKSGHVTIAIICVVIGIGIILLTVSLAINRYHAKHNLTYIQHSNNNNEDEDLESFDKDFKKFMNDENEEEEDKLNISTSSQLLSNSNTVDSETQSDSVTNNAILTQNMDDDLE
ncbi:putative basic-leucine zipper transcription factor [Tieghemostelium lacteum]|uniref:Putative basic-leucine zipper transcription factor n=1 Tax=Tieghemostelium lacteum TaxID=361077 RepID=A0A152A182_TIELA|nr:putative basic-leucine zipper transcription factor [Tieghemostelium lacteum]|eukprot:KYQ99830.1 putative basic-leucine zipper transcription factor [Tieghemostelium lacteum]